MKFYWEGTGVRSTLTGNTDWERSKKRECVSEFLGELLLIKYKIYKKRFGFGLALRVKCTPFSKIVS